MIRYDMLPKHMRDAARAYVERGAEPGHFLGAVLENKLVEALSAADELNRAAMYSWAQWLYNECPRRAWGNGYRVDAWRKDGGMKGIDEGARRKAVLPF